MPYNVSKGFPAVALLREARIYCWLVVGPFSARDVDILFKDEADIVSKEFGTCA